MIAIGLFTGSSVCHSPPAVCAGGSGLGPTVGLDGRAEPLTRLCVVLGPRVGFTGNGIWGNILPLPLQVSKQ